jgi:hypothetical protein
MTRLATDLHHRRTSVTGAAVDAASAGPSPVVLSDTAAPGLHPVRGSAS